MDSKNCIAHFQSLGELKESYKVRLAQLERRLDDLEKIPCYNDLDNVISQKEITLYNFIKCFLKVDKAGKHPSIFSFTILVNYTF
jgi:hypothetical protein